MVAAKPVAMHAPGWVWGLCSATGLLPDTRKAGTGSDDNWTTF